MRAPRDGVLLQINAREGEFAAAAVMSETLMLLGDTETFQVRAEVDEQNAVLVAKEVRRRNSLSEIRLDLQPYRTNNGCDSLTFISIGPKHNGSSIEVDFVCQKLGNIFRASRGSLQDLNNIIKGMTIAVIQDHNPVPITG